MADTTFIPVPDHSYITKFSSLPPHILHRDKIFLLCLDNEGISRDRLLISKKAHLILPSHRMLDAASEAAKDMGKIGSTLKGKGLLIWTRLGETVFV